MVEKYINSNTLYSRKYREENRAYVNEYHQMYYHNHREHILKQRKEREERKRKAWELKHGIVRF